MDKERKSTFTSHILAYVIRAFLKIILFTCKFKVVGLEHLRNASPNTPCIIMLWHNRLALIGPGILAAKLNRAFTAFVSNSRDGDIVAEYTKSYSIGRAVRVPHDSKDRALKTLITRLKLKKEIGIITPDGPRGPKYVLKPGVALAAVETDAPIIPFTWESNRYYEVKSWDRFRIPLPFTTIVATFSAPITLDKNLTLENQVTVLQKALQEK